jgi:hypothetical protein
MLVKYPMTNSTMKPLFHLTNIRGTIKWINATGAINIYSMVPQFAYNEIIYIFFIK